MQKGKLGLAPRRVPAKQGIASQKIPKKTIDGCIVESHASRRQRLESSPPKSHEDHIAGKGYNSMTQYNMVHKFIPVPKAMKILDAKAAVDKEWKKLETNPASKRQKMSTLLH